MKKILALVLVLCMALAAIPAMAEEISGTWYMTLADVTLGTFVLNEDGTANVNLIGQEGTGSWSAEGDTLTVTVDGEAVDFTWDGTSYVTDMLPVPLTREPGKLTYGMVLGVLDPTAEGAEPLPEDITTADAMGIAMNFMTQMASLDTDGSNPDDTSVDTPDDLTKTDTPAADSALAVLRENAQVLESYSGYTAFVYLELENVTEAPVYISKAYLTLYDADGVELANEEYAMYTWGSRYLEPGEKTFIKLSCNLSSADKLASYAYVLETKEDDWYADGLLDVDSTELILPVNEWDFIYLKATVTNNTDAPVSKINVVLALTDADGNILDIVSESLSHELGAGSTITFVSWANNNVAKYCDANGIQPAAVEAYAYLDN